MRFGTLIFFVLISFVLLLIPSRVFAQDSSYITIVNPVRISSYTKDLNLNLRKQYGELKKRDLPATWLLTYDVLKKPKAIEVLKKFDSNQEFGLFLEISPLISEKAGVSYNATNAWHRATSLFLSGYLQGDRKKLIDTYFSEFKNDFGYYPKSVGSWWTDSYSLDYMQKKYGITGVLGVSDQYNLDGYQVWGTPPSIPYYPSKINAAIPAASSQNKIKVVTYRWAARDPLNGFISPTSHEASLYSTQDYNKLGLTNEYFNQLVSLYSSKNDFNKFGQITLGLEADYGEKEYTGQYSEWLDIVKEQQRNGINVTNMKSFSSWYIKTFPSVSPQQVIISDDLLNTSKKVIWISNNLYRVALKYDAKNNNSSIIDFRVYLQNFKEPFYSSPNKQYNLSINLPFIIDAVNDKSTVWNFSVGKLIEVKNNNNTVEVEFEKGSIKFSREIIINNIKIPKAMIDSKELNIVKENNKSIIKPINEYSIGSEGIFYNEYSIHVPFAIYRRVENLIPMIISLGVVIVLVVILFTVLRFKKRGLIYLLIILTPLVVIFIMLGSTKYYISQTEMDALSVLKNFSKGNVLIYNRDCLKCTFTTLKPAAAAGRKGYIEKYSEQTIVRDSIFQIAKNSVVAKKILADENIKYIYLPRYEAYIEMLPYLPQDLGLKRVYENANAEIWEVM